MSRELLVIRADCSPSMGTGHIMRMIALGQAWQDCGGDVNFIGDAGPLKSRLIDEGFEYTHLSPTYPAAGDMEKTTALAVEGAWLAIDGYHFDTRYQQAAQESPFHTLVLDDICDRGKYVADTVLNQNGDAEKYQYDVSSGTDLLLGLRYTLLRREFRENPITSKCIKKQAKRILITMGGTDPAGITPTVLEAIKQLDAPPLSLKVVIGSANPNQNHLQKVVNELSCRVELIPGTEDMVSLMKWADIAITAAGSTCWELCFCGTPMLVIQTAENQQGIFSELRKRDLALCLDSEPTLRNIVAALKDLLPAQAKRKAMSEACLAIIDGKGALRTVSHMKSKTLNLRPATMNDCMLILEWRNHPSVREQSFSSDTIDPETHRKWFTSKLEAPDSYIFIAENAVRQPVGQFRFDIENDEAYVSVSAAPSMTNQGFGTAMTRKACKWLRKHMPETKAIALVKKDNAASAAMFRKAGFTLTSTEKNAQGDHYRFEF